LSEQQLAGFCGACFGKPSQRARGFGKDVVRDKNIVVGVLAVPPGAAQKVADDLVDAGVRIIFNYSEGLLDVPSDVTVHTSNPAVELLHALYFHLA
jgi:redox-sensing transcriptional repressor